MTDRVRLQIAAEDAGKRADVAIAACLSGQSRSAVQTLFRDGLVTIGGEQIKPSRRLSAGDVVEVTVTPRPTVSAEPQEIPLTVVYQDEDLAVIDKPAGLVVHPSAGHESGTLANALAHLFPDARSVGAELRPGIVHRLDKDTSGLMVVALNAAALRDLQAQIANRSASRKYLALVRGRVDPSEGTIDAPIGRHRTDRKRMAVHGLAGRQARTSYRVLEYLEGFTYLEASLHTGRTHQIRVHLAAAGYPVAGDATYGGPPYPGLHRQFLHAHQLTVTSPSSGERLSFTSSLPSDLERVLTAVRGRRAEGRSLG